LGKVLGKPNGLLGDNLAVNEIREIGGNGGEISDSATLEKAKLEKIDTMQNKAAFTASFSSDDFDRPHPW
jgi:hypothetical protein